MRRNLLATVVVGSILTVGACSTAPPKVEDVKGPLKESLNQADLRDVTVSQDREKGVVTIGGHVPSDTDKIRAESIAKSTAPGQVIANEIAVLPPGAEGTAKDINSDLDGGIKKNLDAALLQQGVKDGVKFDVKNGVVTLNGDVNSEGRRAAMQSLAASVPNVQQVVNKLEVKNQKATSTP